MSTRRTVVVLVALLATAIAAVAPASPAVLAKPEHGGDRPAPIVVRPDGSRGELIAYDPIDGGERFRLPPGMAAADGSRFYVATQGDAFTWIEVHDPATGRVVRRDDLAGAWDVGGVSPTGRWVALTRRPEGTARRPWAANGAPRTDLLILDGDALRVVHELTLDGEFEVETISAAGDALFLIQRLPDDGLDRYLVRVYDLAGDFLEEPALRDKRFIDQVMAGRAWDGLATPDGRHLLTLYVNTERDQAFIHTLDLVDKFALCIGLPAGDGDPDRLAAYALTLAPDGRRVYAANPALGVVVEVDLETGTVVGAATFEPAPGIPSSVRPAGVVPADGRTLYFGHGPDVWAYDPALGIVAHVHGFPAPIVGLGTDVEGTRLFAAMEDGPLAAIDTGSGAVLDFPAAG